MENLYSLGKHKTDQGAHMVPRPVVMNYSGMPKSEHPNNAEIQTFFVFGFQMFGFRPFGLLGLFDRLV